MNYLINQLMTVDKAFYRHYLEMLLTLNRIQALTPWQMSMLLWRAKIFHIQVLYPELLRISLCTEQEKDEIRFMKGWKLKELEKIMPAWQRRQCEGTMERLLVVSVYPERNATQNALVYEHFAWH